MRRHRTHSRHLIALGLGLGLAAIAACDSASAPELAGLESASASGAPLIISPSNIRAFVGQSIQLATNAPLPRQADLLWMSLRPDIATVSPSGVVTAVSGGTTLIIAQFSFGSAATGSATIVVTPAPQPFP
jgi:hypothetical protein